MLWKTPHRPTTNHESRKVSVEDAFDWTSVSQDSMQLLIFSEALGNIWRIFHFRVVLVPTEDVGFRVALALGNPKTNSKNPPWANEASEWIYPCKLMVGEPDELSIFRCPIISGAMLVSGSVRIFFKAWAVQTRTWTRIFRNVTTAKHANIFQDGS